VASVPTHVRDTVIRRVYRDAQNDGWEHLSQQAKARWYDRWAADEHVGGILSGYVGPERVRTWLKDGPLKHYANARHGIGPYARFADITGPTPQQIADAVLGPRWTVNDRSVATKPLRFHATRGDDGAAVAYGPARKFRDLLWAALNDTVDVRAPSRAVIAVIEEPVAPTPQSERDVQQRLAAQCQIGVHWVSFAPTGAVTDHT
jgi:hypothetical protein